MRFKPNHRGPRRRAVVGAIIWLSLLALGVTVGRAAEIIPSIGMTRAVNGPDDSKTFGGLAVRGDLTPMIKTEIGLAYRSEDRFNDQLKIRMWPVTASAYLTPIPMLYAGGGVGWYYTTFDYAGALALADETKQEFGVHLGGGLQVQLAPGAGLDLGGRYVMMREQESRLVPTKFDPDFWMTSLGLAIKF